MKTKELVKKLLDADPSGELECAIDGNIDIIDVYQIPAYYDGYLEILERDHSKDPYYNICGGIITGEGMKVRIQPYSIKDGITDDVDFPVKIIGDNSGHYKEEIENYREKVRLVLEKIEKEKR